MVTPTHWTLDSSALRSLCATAHESERMLENAHSLFESRADFATMRG